MTSITRSVNSKSDRRQTTQPSVALSSDSDWRDRHK